MAGHGGLAATSRASNEPDVVMCWGRVTVYLGNGAVGRDRRDGGFLGRRVRPKIVVDAHVDEFRRGCLAVDRHGCIIGQHCWNFEKGRSRDGTGPQSSRSEKRFRGLTMTTRKLRDASLEANTVSNRVLRG